MNVKSAEFLKKFTSNFFVFRLKKHKKIANRYNHCPEDQIIKENYNTYNHYDIYDLNNFCSNTAKIKEKSINYVIQCPTYEELDEEFFEDNNIEVSFFY